MDSTLPVEPGQAQAPARQTARGGRSHRAVKALVTSGVNRAVRPLGVQVVRGWSTDPAIQPFLSARKTIAAARRAGLSVCDYIDQYSAEPGATAATAQAMLRLARLGDSVERVCEIGPGTGRYAEQVIAALKPAAYEVYETATDWLPRLRELPNAVVMPADGHSLSATVSDSVDLVHAQKVFVYVPLVVTVGYLREMARVVRPGGVAAFDVVTENCMDETVTQRWVAEGATLYSMIARQWTIDLLDRCGLSLLGSAFAPLSGGRTELLVFRKRLRQPGQGRGDRPGGLVPLRHARNRQRPRDRKVAVVIRDGHVVGGVVRAVDAVAHVGWFGQRLKSVRASGRNIKRDLVVAA